jgi:hypothetical protein
MMLDWNVLCTLSRSMSLKSSHMLLRISHARPRAPRLRDAHLLPRVVHEHVQRPELRDMLVHDHLAVLVLHEVALDRERLRARGADALDGLLHVLLLLGQVRDRDPARALEREEERGGAPDAGVAAGDERGAAFEPARGASARRADRGREGGAEETRWDGIGGARNSLAGRLVVDEVRSTLVVPYLLLRVLEARCTIR